MGTLLSDRQDEGGYEPSTQGAHLEVLLASAQASDCCKAINEEGQVCCVSFVRQGCCGWIQGEPCQAVQPHQPHQDPGLRRHQGCGVLPRQEDLLRLPCQDPEERVQVPHYVCKVCRAHGTSGTVRAKFTK